MHVLYNNPGFFEVESSRLTNDQINDQDCNHGPQRNMEPGADVGKVLGVRKGLVTGHTPRETRPGVVGAHDDEEVEHHHDHGAEDASSVDGAGDVHPPVHVWL